MEKQIVDSQSFHKILNKWFFIVGISLTLFHRFVLPVGINVQLGILAITVLLVGIPHGALDHLVDQKSKEIANKSYSDFIFFAGYLIKMLLYGMIWFFFPMFSLLFFILLSAFHFGETDLPSFSGRGVIALLLQICYGLMILTILLLSHLDEAIPIFEKLPSTLMPQFIRFLTRHGNLILLSSITATLISGVTYYISNKNLGARSYLNIISQSVLMLGILYGLPLLLGFTFYFGCWHSLHSLENIRLHLSRNRDLPVSWLWMLKKALPFSILAISSILALVFWAGYTSNIPLLILGFFIGIAILTLPHLDVMKSMYKSINSV
jgi:Brp/Blh family beta-carotene 15,15'-monooxygenase